MLQTDRYSNAFSASFAAIQAPAAQTRHRRSDELTGHSKHEFVTDVVQLDLATNLDRDSEPSIASAWFGYGIASSLLEGLAQVVEVPSSDLNATIGRAVRGRIPTIVIYDDVPGGAGLVSKLETPELFRATVQIALARVNGDCGCGEGSSCYGCLRTYRNQFVHPQLQRGPVRNYLRWLVEELATV